MKIVVVGGGSAGWMSAATMISQVPGAEVTVIEPSNIPPIGVGESTINEFVDWLNLLDIEPEKIMKDTDAIFKLAIKFRDFSSIGEDFFYPFGSLNNPTGENTKSGAIEGWSMRRCFRPDQTKSFVDSFYPTMALIRHGTFMRNTPNFPQGHYALHFDAIKFANWLRDNYCIPKGVRKITGEVEHVNTDDSGVTSLVLKDGSEVSGDLYLDCTGFKSMLLGGALKEPFVSMKHVLPNEFAWATQIPYVNKNEECKPYTTCTALGNGWVWNIPVWSRIGTGYVYSDEFISHEQALDEFKAHLAANGRDPETLTYKKIQFKSGGYERFWVKNVVGIGLAAGFIEPLESSGLWTIHNNLTELVKVLHQGHFNEFKKQIFNKTCSKLFDEFVGFVHIHYLLSTRDDTEYWRKIARTSVKIENENYYQRTFDIRFNSHNTYGNGIYCITAGMKFWPFDDIKLKSAFNSKLDVNEVFKEKYKKMDDVYSEWDQEARKAWPMMELLRRIHGQTNFLIYNT